MGQTNMKRTHFEPRVTVLNPKNDDKQDVDFTGYFEINDFVDFIDVDAQGNILNVIADNVQVLAVAANAGFLVLDTVVDTTLATGIPKVRVQQIDDGYEAVDRLYRRRLKGPISWDEVEAIVAQELNAPIAGQTKYDIEDASHFRAGDIVDILADEGIIQSNVTIISVDPNADAANNKATITVAGVYDTSTFTNPFMLSKNITYRDAINRNQERIDGIDTPRENRPLFPEEIGNYLDCAWENEGLFVEASSKLFIDGRKARLGLAGTRATHTEGVGTSQLIFTSMLLGVLGNEIEIVVQAGAGLTVSVTKEFNSSSVAIIPGTTNYVITVNDNGGTATAKDIADAINADTDARRLVQVQYGDVAGPTSDGSGPVGIFSTNLAGGLDDGTYDYAELEQIYENYITGTGFKWVSLHIRPNERNRYNEPPHDDEELVIDYRKATENVDR
jgi:hypothetical protein